MPDARGSEAGHWVALTITARLIRSADTPHTAELTGQADASSWRVSRLPDRLLTRAQAEAAMSIADAARERDELRAALESRAQVLEESRGELRARAERAESDLDAARAELARARQEPGEAEARPAGRRRRGGARADAEGAGE